MARLEYLQSGEQKSFTLQGEEVNLGRMEDNTLVLVDPTISRYHARFFLKNGSWWLEDRSSRNGTKIDGIPLIGEPKPLPPQSTLLFGSVEVRFISTTEQGVTLRQSGEDVSEATIMRRLEDLPGLGAGKGEGVAKGVVEALADTARQLMAASDPETILKRVLDLIFTHLPAERAAILLDRNGTLHSEVFRIRGVKQSKEPIVISSTIANKVFHERVAVITSDAQLDPRFSAGESIIMLGIRSAACVPLWSERRTLGILYCDASVQSHAFGEEDLQLMSLLGSLAAVAIEQAHLRDRVIEEEKARQRLQRYHSPAVVNRILAQGAASMEVTEMDVSVLFCDIVGFTHRSESMSPREVATMLNTCLEKLSQAIFHFEGTLDKYIGDAVMAVFGAPLAQKDHAFRAARCALAMRDALEGMETDLPPEKRLRARWGINSGKVVAGDVGHPERREYTVLGSVVNLASRLESSVAKPGDIVLGPSTHHALSDQMDFESLEPVMVRGLSVPVPVFLLKGEKK